MTPGDLLDVLDRLGRQLEVTQEAAWVELRRRLALRRFRVLVVGEAKRGKSTLINALLARAVLPVGVVPVTAVTTTVAFGASEGVVVEFIGGTRQDEPLEALAGFVSERGNPGNRRRVQRVTVLLDAPLLRDGVELVDTPGAGSVYGHSVEAERALAAMDAAVFVLTADPPVSASERDLLVKVAEASVRTFVVVNKADRLDPAELQDVTSFVAGVTGDALGGVSEVFAYSARAALTARLTGAEEPALGLAGFEAEFGRYLRVEKMHGLQVSVARRACGLALQALDGVRVRLGLAALEVGEAARRSAELRRRLDRIAQHGADAADLASAGVDRLLDGVNSAAARAERELTAEVVGKTQRRLAGELAALSAADLRREGRTVVVEVVRSTVEGWRAGQQQLLEERLRDLEDRLLAGLTSELAGLREAARELLDVELAVEDDRSRLIDDARFFYLLSEGVGWSELVTDSVRRHLPGAAARRRAVAEVVAEADRLTRQQVGRVRADFQYRLQESGRALGRAIRARYEASTATISAALSGAASSHDETVEQTARLGTVLAERETALRGLLDDLAAMADTAS